MDVTALALPEHVLLASYCVGDGAGSIAMRISTSPILGGGKWEGMMRCLRWGPLSGYASFIPCNASNTLKDVPTFDPSPVSTEPNRNPVNGEQRKHCMAKHRPSLVLRHAFTKCKQVHYQND